MCIDRALRGQSLSGAKGVSGKTLYSGAGFPCVETNDSQGNPKNCPNYLFSQSDKIVESYFVSDLLKVLFSRL